MLSVIYNYFHIRSHITYTIIDYFILIIIIIIDYYVFYLLFCTNPKSIDFRPSLMEMDSSSIESPSQSVVKNPLINEGKNLNWLGFDSKDIKAGLRNF